MVSAFYFWFSQTDFDFRVLLSVSANRFRFPRFTFGFRKQISVSAFYFRFSQTDFGFRVLLSVFANRFRFPRFTFGFRKQISVSAFYFRFSQTDFGFRVLLSVFANRSRFPPFTFEFRNQILDCAISSLNRDAGSRGHNAPTATPTLTKMSLKGTIVRQEA